jgi:Fe-Mn family superoxide dismutase
MARELLSRAAMECSKLKPLPYDKHVLEPHIGRETVELHYLKHHVGYVKKLKELTGGMPEESATLEWLIRRSEGAIYNNAAQIWNHDFYWRSMHPDGGGAPSGALNGAIIRSFGAFERLRSDFLEAGSSHFGSGWLWIVAHGESLQVTTTHDADLPGRYGDTALLCADLWEHAYYLDYHAEKARYLEAFFDHLANWEFAAENWVRAAASAPILRRASR